MEATFVPELEPQPIEEVADYASLIYRAGARVADLFVHFAASLFGIFWLSVGSALLFGERAAALANSLGEDTLFGWIFGVLGLILYHTCMEGIQGRSLGKALFGLTVLSEDGRPCSLKQGWIRSFGFLVDGLFCGLIGLMAASGDPRKQRNGDDWADTVVVWTRSLPASLRRSRMELFAAFSMGFGCDALVVSLGCMLSYLMG